MPPRAQTGTPRSTVCWSRTNVSVVPTRPPLSAPLAIRPSAPASTARCASATDVTSTRSRASTPHRAMADSSSATPSSSSTIDALNNTVDTAAGSTDGASGLARRCGCGATARAAEVRSVTAPIRSVASSSSSRWTIGSAPALAAATARSTPDDVPSPRTSTGATRTRSRSSTIIRPPPAPCARGLYGPTCAICRPSAPPPSVVAGAPPPKSRPWYPLRQQPQLARGEKAISPLSALSTAV